MCFLGSAVISFARGRHWGAGGDQLQQEKQVLQPSRQIALPRKLHSTCEGL
ncbi:expressed unknown protein [Ectocarpus siliculosus]|uniref:Uncharacterized protein n=1 Tax=Ectocarpus siliculosus TaxID=2880 RepID=D7G2T6_ECTSI|nr:expressed unknown protein [Ectocarpus siliculosus]|eukprot:CBJ33440.1 expressed unknown protein [Ectocarpus siliculosus]